MNPKFKPGDQVAFINGDGCKFTGKTIVKSLKASEFFGVSKYKGFRYYIEPTDSPWFAVAENELKADYVEGL